MAFMADDNICECKILPHKKEIADRRVQANSI